MRNPEQIETVIYGGAFNPPTLAHQEILQAAVNYARPHGAEVWVMPSGNRIDKAIPATREQRLAYVAGMIEDTDVTGVPTSVYTAELDRSVAVETYDTVVELADTYPDREFRWVFGADSTETMGEWQHGDWLLRNLAMLVVERAGSTINPLAVRALALTIPHLDLSSTELRRRIEQGEPFDDMVGQRVFSILTAS
ncbi:MAG: nicotinate-nicotinamide nucleotide adenylyltransferase [Candidatus Microsaccharimonas sp.]